jgi:hypothetical protein
MSIERLDYFPEGSVDLLRMDETNISFALGVIVAQRLECNALDPLSLAIGVGGRPLHGHQSLEGEVTSIETFNLVGVVSILGMKQRTQEIVTPSFVNRPKQSHVVVLVNPHELAEGQGVVVARDSVLERIPDGPSMPGYHHRSLTFVLQEGQNVVGAHAVVLGGVAPSAQTAKAWPMLEAERERSDMIGLEIVNLTAPSAHSPNLLVLDKICRGPVTFAPPLKGTSIILVGLHVLSSTTSVLAAPAAQVI